ncbi:MAG: endonuclease/exonuclease/phosphatase family protein [Pirellulaceae bacterium]|nr:endonuclease/exonuclease/phosphatase family protein [Pirellulaceae bacterium]
MAVYRFFPVSNWPEQNRLNEPSTRVLLLLFILKFFFFFGPTVLAYLPQSSEPIPARMDRLWEGQLAGTIRFATFNMALERREAGALTAELRTGQSQQAKRLAEIIQLVRPDVLLLNEIDRDDQSVDQ